MSMRAVAALLFLIVVFNGAYVAQRWGPNQMSRFSLMFAMTIDRVVSIDGNARMNLDKAERDGHTYSDKAPSTAFLALPSFVVWYALATATGTDILMPPHAETATWVATMFTSGLLAALGTIALWLLLSRIADRRIAGAATIGLALGTLQLPYSTQLFSHAATIGLLSMAMLLIVSPRNTANAPPKVLRRNPVFTMLLFGGTIIAMLPFGGTSLTLGVIVAMIGALGLLVTGMVTMIEDRLAYADRDFLAGLACALAVTGEYTAAVAATGLFVLLLWSKPTRAKAFLVGALCPIALCAAYNALAFGSPFSIGYQHNDYAWMHQGLLGLQLMFNADAAKALLFSQGRGLFFWSPFLLLILPGYVQLWKNARPLFWLTGVIPLGTLLLLCTMASPYGGAAVGPRYLAPAIPFLVLAAAYGLPLLPRLGRVLIVISIAMNLLPTVVNPQMPEMIPSPFFDYYLVKAFTGVFPLNLGGALGLTNHWSIAPLLAVNTAASLWMLFGMRKEAKTRTAAKKRTTVKPKTRGGRRGALRKAA